MIVNLDVGFLRKYDYFKISLKYINSRTVEIYTWIDTND